MLITFNISLLAYSSFKQFEILEIFSIFDLVIYFCIIIICLIVSLIIYHSIYNIKNLTSEQDDSPLFSFLILLHLLASFLAGLVISEFLFKIWSFLIYLIKLMLKKLS